jgi:hypothetical protein
MAWALASDVEKSGGDWVSFDKRSQWVSKSEGEQDLRIGVQTVMWKLGASKIVGGYEVLVWWTHLKLRVEEQRDVIFSFETELINRFFTKLNWVDFNNERRNHIIVDW